MQSRIKVLLRVIILGDSCVGKTSLKNKYLGNNLDDIYKPTSGTDFVMKQLQLDENVVTMQIWDTTGQERYQSLCASFFRGADACILVYDVNAVETFNNLKRWVDEFLFQADLRNPENFPFVVAGNKTDKEGPRISVAYREEMLIKLVGRSLPIFETSAKQGFNIDQLFQFVAHSALYQPQDDDK